MITNKRKQKTRDKILYQCHSVHDKSHTRCPGSEPGPPRQ